MKKSALLFHSLFSFYFISVGQTLDWAQSMGGTEDDIGESIAVDGSGNVYTTGYFRGTADFDPDSGSSDLMALGLDDIFIQKLDAGGNLLWVKRIGGSSYDQGRSIALDGSGNVYIMGWFERTVDFDPNAGISNLTAVGREDIFIQKLNAQGNLLWAKSIGGSNVDIGNAIALDDSGNVYTTGFFRETVDFDPNGGVSNLTAVGFEDIFIQKLDTDGNLLWAKSMGGTGLDIGYAITLDDSGNVYATGFFSETVDFDPNAGISNLTTEGDWDIFIQKLDAGGNFIWAKSMGGVGLDAGNSLAVDSSGNVYIAGFFNETVDFDPNTNTNNLMSAGLDDIFIQKLDAGGNFIWAKRIGGTSADRATSISLDDSANVYATGYFSETVDFDPNSSINELTAEGSWDIFIQKLDMDGNLHWVKSMGGIGLDLGNSLTVDHSGNVYTTGFFSEIVDFDPDEVGITYLMSIGGLNSDIFIQKLSSGGNVGIENIEQSTIKLYPNPGKDLFKIELPVGTPYAQIKIMDHLGRIVYEGRLNQPHNELNLSHLSMGMYVVSMILNTGDEYYGKIIVNQ